MKGGTYGLLLAALGSINLELDLVTGGVTAENLGVQLELHALLLQDLLGRLGNLSVHAGAANLAEELDDGDLGSETRPDRSHLETDDTTTNDDHGLGNLLEGDGAGAGDDALLVNLKTGERGGLRTSGNQNVLAADGGLATIVERNLDLILADEGAGTLEVLSAILLEKELDALGEAVYG